MKNRTYNIIFHTHTVSGIVISVVLYIIFFAGSFSFFRDEIANWERNESVEITDDIQLDFDKALDSLHKNYNLYGRDVALKKTYIEQRISVSMSASKDSVTSNKTEGAKFFYLDTKNNSKHTYDQSYTLGEFLYRLHFLTQIPYPFGYYLSGFVAFFFLFAIITGVVIHWKKIVSNFYVFRPLSKLKTMWTDAHTTLGLIGLPFQFVYAVTGAFFMIKLVLVAPSVLFLYGGDNAKLYEDLEYSKPQYQFKNNAITSNFNASYYVTSTKKIWNDFDVTEVHLFNYGDENMHILVNGHLNYNTKFNGIGEVIFNVKTGEIVSKKSPITDTSYLDGVKNVLYKIHYADYGGFPLKIISFILGLITCFVIISGVMIWLVARDKKNIPEKKRRFNERVVRIYLAICLSMYPITALSFIAVKVFQPTNSSFIHNFYFMGWLLLTLFFVLKKDLHFINKYTLLSGSIIGFFIPISNGIMTGNWFWKTFLNQQFQLFFVDIFWLILASLTLWISLKLKRLKK
ncbi:PepSY-associated TM helix domain-containing protein [Polaribacter sp. Hel1_85]|uniref:PepSY-associated TM helix domain-containing protein n=1 Tax=Polaribacter sp. Hel1_85 TaxID=1250005 RepID=UPI00052D3A08|nr:PepSY-associated TM helix domain-containing protein [Polaribacter sp. Hel1_85]KGL62982.1 pepSY-associated TM helix domain protein-containing protein [Polaribacter sp. Hel1_85]